MTRTDEQYAQVLRERAEAAVPSVDVDLDRVVPRARRRRAAVRGGLATGTLVLVVGAAWGATAVLGVGTPQGIAPAGPTSHDEAVTPDGTAPAGASPTAADSPARPTVPAVAVVADDGTVTGVPGDPWGGDERYWYVLTEQSWGQGAERMETWSSRERPGLMVYGGDLGDVAAKGPVVVMGSWGVAGQRYEMLTDPRVLPTDAAGLARAARVALEEGRGTGSDDDKVFEVLRTSLSEAGLWTPELREALWGAVATLPGTQASVGEDALGRTGDVLRYTDSAGAVTQLVRDPVTGLLLEEVHPGEGHYVRYLEQRAVGEVPLEPTLEIAGCGAWKSC
ncbi:hypothetical protein Cfla_2503 [Cellulomonas flavigena DSM 20109]|uniref:CU044_5270 family protein n=1 Tax=Cellulomonas flavigena (strain ATCC 482 / DSM 20109 / BCRC 11376 / JCM 18109 / NBRC 3775 / NCIMB 8073 / NRS 134) TaxID=446466 RepID=D5UI46_CELFN|nr:hypothetical protein [Cellulomonas flavigena]ADG75391.1 hypothetical protein Cfla_2503 [Cellulomonas flavigena DSM 20109]